MCTKHKIYKTETGINFKNSNWSMNICQHIGLYRQRFRHQGKRAWPAPVFSNFALERNWKYHIACNIAGMGTHIFIATDTEKKTKFLDPTNRLLHVIGTGASILKQNRQFRHLGRTKPVPARVSLNSRGHALAPAVCIVLISRTRTGAFQNLR